MNREGSWEDAFEEGRKDHGIDDGSHALALGEHQIGLRTIVQQAGDGIDRRCIAITQIAQTAGESAEQIFVRNVCGIRIDEKKYKDFYKQMCWLCSWSMHSYPGPKDGSSILFCKAIALGAIALYEGAYREPKRKRRLPQVVDVVCELKTDKKILRWLDEIGAR